jgi:hypothetical protein
MENNLRQNSVVQAWIAAYQNTLRHPYPDCQWCGWPHAEVLLCGSGSTFGCVRLGGTTYYIDMGNVEFMLSFVNKLGPGFHWKNEIFFNVEDGNVVVSHIEPFNNCPHVKKWTIPLAEWQSITDSVSNQCDSKRS